MTDKKREYQKEYMKAYRLANKEKASAYHKDYYNKNKDKIDDYHREYRRNNSSKRSESRRLRKDCDPLYKLKCTLRSRAGSAFFRQGYKKSTKTQEMLGAEWEIVKAHIESKFTEGMTWSNHGDWHVDHIVPLASANTEEELIKLSNYKNLQPLWAEDNLKKGDKI